MFLRAAIQMWREFLEAKIELNCFDTLDNDRISIGSKCSEIWISLSKYSCRFDA